MNKQKILVTVSSAMIASTLLLPVTQLNYQGNMHSMQVQAMEVSAIQEPLKVAVLSDLHIFPESYVGNKGPNYQAYINGDRKMLEESERILAAYISELLTSDVEIVLVPGDLTKDSEPEAHEIVARQLQRLEDAGKQVFVTNGNHDINAPDAEKFVAIEGTDNDEVVKLQGVTRDEFETIHQNFGFNVAETIAQDPNSTSYVAKLKAGYRLIVMDTGIYGADSSEQSTSGTLNRDGRLEWILEQVAAAKADGDIVIGMGHHGFVEHFDGQGTIFAPYLVENYETVAQALADAGMEYVFTGHFHAQDIAVSTTALGNTLKDIMTGSTVSYPSPIRYVEIDGEIGKIHIESHALQAITGIDEFEAYGKEMMTQGVPGMVSSLLSGILTDMVTGITVRNNAIVSLDSAKLEALEAFVGEYIQAKLEANSARINELQAETGIEGVSDDQRIIPGILTKQQLINFIEAVCEGLKTVEVETSIADNYKLMDAVTHILLECYAGDETYSAEMQTLKAELETTSMVADALTQLIVQHKGKLGFVVGMLINEKVVQGIFQAEISEGTTISMMIGGAFAGLVDSILSDDTPDNNVAYIAERVVDFDLSKLLSEAKALAQTVEMSNRLRLAIEQAEQVLLDVQATIETITETKAMLAAAIENPADPATEGLGPEGDIMPEVDAEAEPELGPEGDVMPEVEVGAEPELGPLGDVTPEVEQESTGVTPTPEGQTSTENKLPSTGLYGQELSVLGVISTLLGGAYMWKRKK
ncbi:MAG: metallophosphoesterase [Culicoidibacterales bacterium]